MFRDWVRELSNSYLIMTKFLYIVLNTVKSHFCENNKILTSEWIFDHSYKDEIKLK